MGNYLKVKYYCNILWYSFLKVIRDSRELRSADPEDLIKLSESKIPVTPEQIAGLNERFSKVSQALCMNGVCKMTHRGRLRQTENMLCKYLSDRSSRQIAFLDVGASDGGTTLDAVYAMRSGLGKEIQTCLIDRNLWLYRYRYGVLLEYRGEDGVPVILRIGPIALRLDKEHKDFLTKKYLTTFEPLRLRLTPAGRISLLNPLVMQAKEIHPEVANCLEYNPSFRERFDAVRASNILNHCYFDGASLRLAISHLFEYLQEDGVLLISRNRATGDGEVEIGTIWRKRSGRLIKLEDFGGGTDIKDILDENLMDVA